MINYKELPWLVCLFFIRKKKKKALLCKNCEDQLYEDSITSKISDISILSSHSHTLKQTFCSGPFPFPIVFMHLVGRWTCVLEKAAGERREHKQAYDSSTGYSVDLCTRVCACQLRFIPILIMSSLGCV